MKAKLRKKTTVTMTLRTDKKEIAELMASLYRLSLKDQSLGARSMDHINVGAFWEDLEKARKEFEDGGSVL